MKISVYLGLGMAFLMSFPAVAQSDAQKPSISLTGECLRQIPQDRASLTLTAEFLDANAGTSAKKATSQYNEVLARVKKLNLKDAEVSTSEYSVQEDFDYKANTRKSRGFKARNGVQIETSEIERVGEVIKVATDLGVKNISGLSMFVSNARWKAERESCLEEAYLNAKSKADRLAKVSGSNILGVLRIDESGSSNVAPRAFYANEMMMADARGGLAKSSQVQGRNESLQVNLNVVFQIK